jgi:formate dehydrogenase maturation protein FdhE
MNCVDQLPSRVVSALQELAEQEKEAVARCAQRARQRLLDQKVGPGEARDQLQLYAMGEASAHKRADDYARLAQKGHCPACWVWKSSLPVLSLAMEGGALRATCPACEREWVVQVVPGQTALWMTDVSSV